MLGDAAVNEIKFWPSNLLYSRQIQKRNRDESQCIMGQVVISVVQKKVAKEKDKGNPPDGVGAGKRWSRDRVCL